MTKAYCPFCGCLTLKTEQILSTDGEWAYSVRCVNPKCAAIGPFRETAVEAVTAWNTRIQI